MATPGRNLRVAYREREVFEREFEENIRKGGIFVAGAEPRDVRSRVTVLLDLEYAKVSVALEGEVVHCIMKDLAVAGAKPGVAIQFDLTPAELVHRLAPLAESGGQRAAGPTRKTPRADARVEASVEVDDDVVFQGRTRNLSRGGALVSVQAGDPPPPESVKLTLNDPSSGSDVEVRGRVVRQIQDKHGEVSAIAVAFEDPESDELDGFFGDLESRAHTRKLGAIEGQVAELGTTNLVQMFGGCAREGTLTIRSQGQEAYVVFDAGLLRAAEVAGIRGLKAFSRILAWEDGSFTFEPQIDETLCSEAPLPLDVALLEANSMLEALAAHPTPSPDTVLRATSEDPSGAGDLSKLEQAILELASVGMKVTKVLDIIPEPDAEILDALSALEERGLLSSR